MVAGAGVDVYLGQTRFTKPNAVAVESRELRFNKAVIATGSRAVAPKIEVPRSWRRLHRGNDFTHIRCNRVKLD